MVGIVFSIWLLSVLSEYAALRSYTNTKLKNSLALFASLLIVVSSIMLLVDYIPLGAFFCLVALYRIINNARIYASRLPLPYAQSVIYKSLVALSLLQLSILMIALYNVAFDVSLSHQVVFVLTVASLVGAIIILIATISNLWGSQPKPTKELNASEYPTVTVAIAARNETPMLVDCIQSVIASSYPKLEVLVFDDNSQDTTAEIIKSFAHDGVRFITWEYSKEEWLSKNKAYQILLEHASGDVILYMGVDVRLHQTSIHKAVEQMLARDVSMLGLVPRRTKSGLLAVFVQPARYWWELAVPKIARRRPPILSTAWLIDRNKLLSVGGFTSYKRSIVPEEHLARYFSQQQAYALVRSTKQLIITTQKSFGSQWDTQVRTRYPHARRRPELALFQSILLICIVLWPFIALPIYVLYDPHSLITLLLILSTSLYVMSHLAISIITNPIAGIFAPINFPVAIALDILALHESLYKYEFSKVIWKGRDIAPKKLKVIAKLPDLEPTPNLENTH